MWEHDLNISVYNVYARENAYQISFSADDTFTGQSTRQQLSLFRIVPSVTYNFKFTYLKKERAN